MLDSFIDFQLPLDLAEIRYHGNKNLDLLNITTAEIGWRGKFSFNLSKSITLFGNFRNLMSSGQTQYGFSDSLARAGYLGMQYKL